MSGLQFPDIAGSFQQGHRFGTQNRLLGESEQRRSSLAALAGQAYNATGDQRNQLVGQAVGVDPAAGFQLQQDLGSSEDQRTKTLVNAAKLLTSAPEQQRPHLYQRMKGDLARLGLQMPEQYDDTVAQTAAAITQAYSGMDKASQVQSTYIDAQGNRVAILRDGSTQILGQNAPNNEIIDTGNGFYGVNKGNLQAAPVQQVGGAPQQTPPQQQAPQPGMYQTPQGIVRLGDDLSPEQREAAMADMAQGGTAQNVSLMDRNVAPQQYGGSQLRSAPKQQAPTELEKRIQMAQQMGATPEQLQAIVLGNASTNGPTAAEQKDALARKAKQPQVANAVRGLGRIENAVKALSGGMVNTGPLDQYATRYSKAGQELEAAVGGIQNSLLSLTRVPGIGSQSDLEARIANMQYPSLDKDPEVNARTVENLKAFIADLEQAYKIADAPVSGNGDKKGGSDIDSLLDLYK